MQPGTSLSYSAESGLALSWAVMQSDCSRNVPLPQPTNYLSTPNEEPLFNLTNWTLQLLLAVCFFTELNIPKRNIYT